MVRDRSYRLFCCMGTTHLFLLASKGFLRPAAHEGVPSRLIHSELSPYIGSLSVAMSRTMFARRGQTLCSCVVKDTSRLAKCQLFYFLACTNEERGAQSKIGQFIDRCIIKRASGAQA